MRILHQMRHAYQLANLTYPQRKTLSYASVALCRPQLSTRHFGSTQSGDSKFVKHKKVQKRYRRNPCKPIYGSMFRRRSSRSISSITPVAVISRDDKIQKIALIPIKLVKGKQSNREALQAAMDIFEMLQENGHDVDFLIDHCKIEAPMVTEKTKSNSDISKKCATTTKFESEADQMKNACEKPSTLPSATEFKVQYESQDKTLKKNQATGVSSPKLAQQQQATDPECGSLPKSSRNLCRSCVSKTSVSPSRKPSSDSKCGRKLDSAKDVSKKSLTIPENVLTSKSKSSPRKNLLKCGSSPRSKQVGCSKTPYPSAELPTKTSKSDLNKDLCKKSKIMTNSTHSEESPPNPCKPKSSIDSKPKYESQEVAAEENVEDSSTSESNKEPCKKLSTSAKTVHEFESKPGSSADPCRSPSKPCSRTPDPTVDLRSKMSKYEDHCKKSKDMTKGLSITESPPDPCKKSSTAPKTKCGSQMVTPKAKVEDGSGPKSIKEPCVRLSISPKTKAKLESNIGPCQKSKILPSTKPNITCPSQTQATDGKISKCGSSLKSKQSTPATPELRSEFEAKSQKQSTEGKPRTSKCGSQPKLHKNIGMPSSTFPKCASKTPKCCVSSKSNRDLCKSPTASEQKIATPAKCGASPKPNRDLCRSSNVSLVSETKAQIGPQEAATQNVPATAKCGALPKSNRDLCRSSSASPVSETKQQLGSQEEPAKPAKAKCGALPKSNRDLCRSSSASPVSETKAQIGPQEAAKQNVATTAKCGVSPKSNRDLCRSSNAPEQKIATPAKCGASPKSNRDLCRSSNASPVSETKQQLGSQEEPAKQSGAAKAKCGASPKSNRDLCRSSNALPVTETKEQPGSPEEAAKQNVATPAKCGASPKSNRDLCRSSNASPVSETNAQIGPQEAAMQNVATTAKCGASPKSNRDLCRSSNASPVSETNEQLGSQEEPAKQSGAATAKCGAPPKSNRDLCRSSSASRVSETNAQIGPQEAATQNVATTAKCGASPKSNRDLCRSSNASPVSETKEQLGSHQEPAKQSGATTAKCGASHKSNRDLCRSSNASSATAAKVQFGSQNKAAKENITTSKRNSLSHASQQACKRAAKAKCGSKIVGDGSKKSYPSSTCSSEPKSPLYPPQRKAHTLSIALKPFSGELENPTNFILSRYLFNEHPKQVHKETTDIAKARQYDFKNNSNKEALLSKPKKPISGPKIDYTADVSDELCAETTCYRIYAKRGKHNDK